MEPILEFNQEKTSKPPLLAFTLLCVEASSSLSESDKVNSHLGFALLFVLSISYTQRCKIYFSVKRVFFGFFKSDKILK